jgi:hypothetical protein
MNLKFCTAFALLVSLSGTASADITGNHKQLAFAKPVALEKKKAVVKLYPNPSTNGKVRVVTNTAGKNNFYIFDLEGTLLHQAVIKQNEKHTISNLKKGVYTYDAFYNDEGVDHGKLIVK